MIVQSDALAYLADLEAVDHIITDPPYGAQVEAGYTSQRDVAGGKHVGSRPGLGIGIVDPEFIDSMAAEFARICGRWCLVFSCLELAHVWREALVDHGMRYVRTGAWIRPNGAPQFSGDRPAVGFEPVTICHRADVKLRWNGRGARAAWNYPRPVGRARHGHPTTKPIDLMRTLVRQFTDLGETIADPFAGSGQTLVAAAEMGRVPVGCDLSPRWAAVATDRVSRAVEQTELPW